MVNCDYYMKNKASTKKFILSNKEKLLFQGSSIFKPKIIKDLIPKGLSIYTFNAGFKKVYDDLLIIIFDRAVSSFSVFSKTTTPSAPIIWNKKNNSNKTKALIINSGNANAHTGNDGLKIIDKYVEILNRKFNCKKKEVLICSTGVIGEIFDPNLISNKILLINNKKKGSLLDAAKTITTTDTFPKIIIKNVKIDNTFFKIYGIAKGSGMIQPNMGTMLVNIFVEAKVSVSILKKIVKINLENTFNSISVDNDTSTSDTLSIFSLNLCNINLNKKNNFIKLNKYINQIMKDLALQVIKDGEGITKLIEASVTGAKSKKQAKNIAFSIVNSPLVKTAISGEDANWGRIIMAIGKSRENIIQDKIKIYFGSYLLCKSGKINPKINILKINKYMKDKFIKIRVDLGIGINNHKVYGNDLSYDYIKINSDYRS